MAGSWSDSIADELKAVEDNIDDSITASNPELAEMCYYVLKNPGKRVRPAMCILTYLACGGDDPTKAINVGSAVEIIHNATLIHDDINDEAELRRGRKALYKEYTLTKAIVAGDFLFAVGFRLIGITSDEIVEFVVAASSAMGAGEFDQQDYEHNVDVTEDEYVEIVKGKTARLIECAAKCGASLANAKEELIDAVGEYAINLGIAFQIIDDTLDVIGDSKKTGKAAGNDLIEGKPTIPVIYAMEDPVEGDLVRRVFAQDQPSEEDVAAAVEAIKRTDSIERCRKLARVYLDKCFASLEALPESKYRESLKGLAEYILERDR